MLPQTGDQKTMIFTPWVLRLYRIKSGDLTAPLEESRGQELPVYV